MAPQDFDAILGTDPEVFDGRSCRRKGDDLRFLSHHDLMRTFERMLRRELQELLDAALGVVGERIDAGELLLSAGDPERRSSIGERAGAAHRRDHDLGLGRDQRRRRR